MIIPKDKWPQIQLRNISLSNGQFYELCHDPAGLGLYQFSLCLPEQKLWLKYTHDNTWIPLEKQMEWLREECDKWLDKRFLSRHSVEVELVFCDKD